MTISYIFAVIMTISGLSTQIPKIHCFVCINS